MGTINLNGFFNARKIKILNELTKEMWDKEGYIDCLTGLTDSKDIMIKEEMKLIQLKELYRKIDNIQEDI